MHATTQHGDQSMVIRLIRTPSKTDAGATEEYPVTGIPDKQSMLCVLAALLSATSAMLITWVLVKVCLPGLCNRSL